MANVLMPVGGGNVEMDKFKEKDERSNRDTNDTDLEI